MHATDIVAYAYAADIYCPDCTRHMAEGAISALVGRVVYPSWPTEGTLDVWAAAAMVNRHEEETFDSGDFPKVVFASDEWNESSVCGSCLQPIIDV